MGHLLSTEIETKIGLFGWNGAGKTTLLYKMVTGETVYPIPTIGFNVETFKLFDTKFVTWDLGGRGKIRPLHRHYYPGLDAVVYVVDVADQSDIMQEAIEEFTRMVNEPELRDCVFMLLGNKQDLPGALSMDDIAKRFNVDKVKQTLYVQGITATDGSGLHEAFHMLATQLKERKRSKWSRVKESVSKYTTFFRCTAPHEQIVE